MENIGCPILALLPDHEYEYKLASFALKDGCMIVLVSNEEYCDVCTRVRFNKTITSTRSVNRYEGYRTWFAEDILQVPVPMCTLEMMEVRFEDKNM